MKSALVVVKSPKGWKVEGKWRKAEIADLLEKAFLLGQASPIVPRERPRILKSSTRKVFTGHGNAYISVSLDEQGKPFEVFCGIGKAGACAAADSEAISRLVSLSLRSRIEPGIIVKQLAGITCHVAIHEGETVRSNADAIALVLAEHVEPSAEQ